MASRFWALYHKITRAEETLEPHLAALGQVMRFQHPVLGYFADFAFLQHMLIVEVDGASHRKKGAPEADAIRDHRLGLAGWRVLRFTNEEVFADPGRVAAQVRSAMTLPADVAICLPSRTTRTPGTRPRSRVRSTKGRKRKSSNPLLPRP